MTDYVTSKIKENQTVSDDELPQTAKCIAMAALKYGDLSNMPTKMCIRDRAKPVAIWLPVVAVNLVR